MREGLAPTFWRVVLPSGAALISADRTPWPEHLAVSIGFVEVSDSQYVSRGDGMLRFAPDLGPSALYGFAHDEGPDVAHYDLIRVDA